MEGVETWFQKVVKGFNSKEAFDLRDLFNISKAHENFNVKTDRKHISNEMWCRQIFGHQEHKLRTVSLNYLNLTKLYLKATRDWNKIVPLCLALFDAWIDLYCSPELEPSSWMVPAFYNTCQTLNSVCREADAEAKEILEQDESDLVDDDAGGDGSFQTCPNQQRMISAMRQNIGKFRGDPDHQAGYVILITESIKGCMNLRKLQMASFFVKTIESSPINPKDVPLGPMIDFKFFEGKLYMQQEMFVKAERSLFWAFSRSRLLKSKFNLTKMILDCLVAVRLRLGKLPRKELLESFRLHYFLPLIEAIRSGNLALFNQTLHSNEANFVRDGTLLCLEKSKFICFRALIMRLIKWHKLNCQPSEGHKLKLSLFTAAVKFQLPEEEAEDFDDEESACILATVMKLGLLKGYIAWEQNLVVLSKTNPTPALSVVSLQTEKQK